MRSDFANCTTEEASSYLKSSPACLRGFNWPVMTREVSYVRLRLPGGSYVVYGQNAWTKPTLAAARKYPFRCYLYLAGFFFRTDSRVIQRNNGERSEQLRVYCLNNWPILLLKYSHCSSHIWDEITDCSISHLLHPKAAPNTMGDFTFWLFDLSQLSRLDLSQVTSLRSKGRYTLPARAGRQSGPLERVVCTGLKYVLRPYFCT